MPVSDHFHPWFHSDAAGGFAWAWIAAAAAKIPDLQFGTMITAPIGRYHPAIIAQAFATIDEMFPGRVFLGLGTGEAMNEIPLGFEWPKFSERLQRLKESLEIIRMLWTSKFVNYRGQFYTLKDANLYTKPRTQIPIYVVANGPKSAALAGRYADGFGTVAATLPRFSELWRVVEKSAVEVGKDPNGISRNIELMFSYNPDYDRAIKSAGRWKSGLIQNVFNLPIYDPRELEKRGEEHGDEEVATVWTIATSGEVIIKKAVNAIGLGFNRIELHSSSPSEEEFLAVCKSEVLPSLAEEYATRR